MNNNKKIITITGMAGSGKTTVAKALLWKLKNSAHIESDSLISVNPFIYNANLEKLGIRNIVLLIKNFFSSGYENIIISGLIRNKKIFNYFYKLIKPKTKIYIIHLEANKKSRAQRRLVRARDGADTKKWIDWIDKKFPEDFTLNTSDERYKFLKINNDEKSLKKIIERVNNFINQ